MGDEGQRDYFLEKIAEQCQSLRLLSLKMSDVSLQVEGLKATQAGLLQSYAAQQAELQNLSSLAHKMLGLKGEWICAIDSGKLIQVPREEPSPVDEVGDDPSKEE